MHRSALGIFTLLVLLAMGTSDVFGQRGSGAPGAFIQTSTGVIGGTFDVTMGIDRPRGGPYTGLLSVSGGFTPRMVPSIGQVWLDVFSPAYFVVPFPMGLNPTIELSASIPQVFAQFNSQPVFANFLVAGPSVGGPGYSMSRTIRIQLDTIDGYRPAGTMLEPRGDHTATLLSTSRRDNVSEVLIAGGGTGSIIIPVPSSTTEIWSPLTRSFRPGPQMLEPRQGHAATQLEDGRVLITGGVTTGGIVTGSAEIFDPITETFTTVSAMSQPRAGHAATLLVDGRVIVSGGLMDWQNAATAFMAALNTASDTIEIYDPITDSWAAFGTPMSSPRTGHTHVLLPNQVEILIIGGVSGGARSGVVGATTQVPLHTNTVDRFDFLFQTLSPAAPLSTARGFHGSSILPNGNLLVTGGSVNSTAPTQVATGGAGQAIATTSCEVFDGTSWTATAPLLRAAAFHTQVRSRWNGDAIIFGGFTGDFSNLDGTPAAGRHNGTLYGESLDLGLHNQIPGSTPHSVGTHTCTELQDGSYLVVGGASWPNTSANAYTVVEPQ